MNINAEVTPEARDYLVSLLAKQEVPGMAARVYVEKGGTQHAETSLAFCPQGEESARDVRRHFEELALYFDAASVPYLQDMQIGIQGEGKLQSLTIKAPNSKKPAKPPKTFVLPESCEALQVPHVEDSKVDIVFDPPWSYDSLEEEARLELGLI